MAVGVSERGSLRSGLGEWVLQRLTAVYILFFTIAAVVRLTLWPVTSYQEWHVLSSGLFYRVTTLILIFSLLLHAWLGLKSVLLDYVHPWRLRFVILMLFAFALLGTGVWALLVIGLQ
jgi:succinate dehydrogenase / fumarate reductase membrane anchor subunit